MSEENGSREEVKNTSNNFLIFFMLDRLKNVFWFNEAGRVTQTTSRIVHKNYFN